LYVDNTFKLIKLTFCDGNVFVLENELFTVVWLNNETGVELLVCGIFVCPRIIKQYTKLVLNIVYTYYKCIYCLVNKSDFYTI